MAAFKSRSCFVGLIFILLVLWGGSRPALAPGHPAETASRKRNIKRTDDPVLIAGNKMPTLAGVEIGGLSLMRWRGNSFEPVPFQVDKRNVKGEYTFGQAGAANGKPARPGSPLLQADDEMAFMIGDAGDRAPATSLPANVEKGVELEIVDPVPGDDGGRAWAYLFAFKKDAPRSERRYLKGKPDTQKGAWRIEAQNYSIEAGKNAVYYNLLAINRPDGAPGPNLIDRLKIRGTYSIHLSGHKIPLAADDLIQANIVGWNDGPVRVLVKGDGYVDTAVKFRIKGYSIIEFYGNLFIYSLYFHIPFEPGKLLKSVDLYGADDFSKSAYGLHYYDKCNPWNKDIVFDGKMSDAEKNMNVKDDRNWFALTGPQGSLLTRVFLPKEWGFVKKGAYYLDDAARPDPPEAFPGVSAAGFSFSNLTDVRRGWARYSTHHYFPRQFKMGAETRILNIMDHPLEVKVRPIGK